MYIEKSLEKFNIDKSYKYFPGNTIIHFLTDKKQINTIISIKNEMAHNPLYEKFVFLPEDSYHMTVCDILTYNDLLTNKKFSNFKFKKLKDSFLINQQIFQELGDNSFILNIKMIPVEIKSKKIVLKPKSIEDENKLKHFRSGILEKLGIIDEENYKFHISLAYQIEQFNENEKKLIDDFLADLNFRYLNKIGVININIAYFTLFNDMSKYLIYKN